MKILVDADACPKPVREMLFRVAQRVGVAVIFIANQRVAVPPSPFIRSLQVEQGFDVADNEIVRQSEKDDLVITADIPLAAEAIEKGAVALTPRGVRYTRDNVKAKLTMRDFMETLRASGIQSGGPVAYSAQDKQQFANELDSYVARHHVTAK